MGEKVLSYQQCFNVSMDSTHYTRTIHGQYTDNRRTIDGQFRYLLRV